MTDPQTAESTTVESEAEPMLELDQTSVANLLAEAWRDKRTGALKILHGQSERCIQLQDGAPTAIESSLADDGFAQFLEDQGMIPPVDRFKIERFATEREVAQTSAVLALQLLDAKSLYKAIRSSTRNQICEAFEWQAGQYRWTACPEEAESTGKPHDILSLLQQQLPRRWGSDRLFQALIASSESRGDIPPRFRRVVEKLAQAGEPARKAIAQVDAGTPVGQILGECAGDPLAASTLWTLLHAGILRVGVGRRSRESITEELQFEVEVTDARAQSSQTSSANLAARKAASKAKANADSEALRSEIETLLEQLSSLDHYSALGLTAAASPAQLKRAYFKAAKKFHPDTLVRLGLEDLRDNAARVFARIAEAFETLSDSDKKAAYDAGGSDEPEIDTARLAQAETSFRKGEILVRMGNFHGALEYLEPAVELWPDEPAYQSGLGWALYKQPKSDAARACEHLEIASAQAPEDAVILFRLGVVLRAVGETDTGDAMVTKAQRLEPTLEE